MNRRIVLLRMCCVALFVFLVALSDHHDPSASSQNNTSGKFKSMRIIRNKPTVYLSFERAGKREPLLNGESEEGVWLRLHNNSRWAIILEMNDVPSKDYGDARLFYEVLADAKVLINAKCHVCSVDRIPAGKSILFSLPREYLDKDRAVRITFNYEWEADEKGSTSLEPEHYVYFSSSNLPKALVRSPNGRQ